MHKEIGGRCTSIPVFWWCHNYAILFTHTLQNRPDQPFCSLLPALAPVMAGHKNRLHWWSKYGSWKALSCTWIITGQADPSINSLRYSRKGLTSIVDYPSIHELFPHTQVDRCRAGEIAGEIFCRAGRWCVANWVFRRAELSCRTCYQPFPSQPPLTFHVLFPE